jgi:uncharacterized protein with HEPN domain
MLDSRTHKLLLDILFSAKRIILLLANETLESFSHENSLDIQDIVVRRLTIIGEAAASILRIQPDFCEIYPSINLRMAKGIRNILVHQYDGIDWDIVWETANNDLPRLVAEIQMLGLTDK